ncbi:MAG: CRP/FNR family transcriptional regulator, cyclic AMP receptor protein [Lachnoclostridium sp.]|jgi:CRP/FNR family transcriptional regulator, cyclic AMP receptor protein
MSGEDKIKKLMELQKSLPSEKQEYLNRYLKNSPLWFLESMQIVHKEKDCIFIAENAEVDYVYILVDGIVKAIDYRICGIVYDYMWFYAIEVFGAMEILLNMDKYKTTLKTVTDCTMIVMSKSKYERWLFNDIHALHMEIESIGRYLLEQARKERVFLFLQGVDRIIYLFTQIFEQSNEKNRCVLNLTRVEISERSGLSVKTINRAIKKMTEEGYISRDGNKIIISYNQYLAMKKYLTPIVDQ